jgi:TPR repeat protein
MGHGVQRSYELAKEWYEKAAKAGDSSALQRIQELPKQ